MQILPNYLLSSDAVIGLKVPFDKVSAKIRSSGSRLFNLLFILNTCNLIWVPSGPIASFIFSGNSHRDDCHKKTRRSGLDELLQ